MALTRGRGGFLRSGEDGPPYVSDPNGALTKGGTIKRLCYGSPSGFGEVIGDSNGLVTYGGQRAVLGMALDRQLWWDADAIKHLDPEDPQFKSEATRIFRQAKTVGGDGLSADRGSLFHAVVERSFETQGVFDPREFEDWGRKLAFGTDAQLALLRCWWQLLADNGLEQLASEVAVVNDRYRKAGTLDAIVRATRDLLFVTPHGELRTVRAGTILVLDLKTGKLRIDRDGSIKYWRSYPIQVHCYASSVPYDTITEVRGTWEWDIDQQHGLIAHLDVAGAIAGEPAGTLVYVDLEAAQSAAELCVAAEQWEKRKDMFALPYVALEAAA